MKTEKSTYAVDILNYSTKQIILSYEGWHFVNAQMGESIEFEGIVYEVKNKLHQYLVDDEDRFFVKTVITVKEVN